ncbi:MAG: DUF2087 domain-containing protein [Oscillospiraceae bacterium]
MLEISTEEREKILGNVFSSRDPLIMKVYSSKFKKKIVALEEISRLFEKDKKYTEKEINELLQGVYPDFVTLRRDLIEQKILAREKDGSAYWCL